MIDGLFHSLHNFVFPTLGDLFGLLSTILNTRWFDWVGLFTYGEYTLQYQNLYTNAIESWSVPLRLLTSLGVVPANTTIDSFLQLLGINTVNLPVWAIFAIVITAGVAFFALFVGVVKLVLSVIFG